MVVKIRPSMFRSGVTMAYCIDECLDIFDAEAEGDDHGDSQDTVESDAPHHGPWEFFRCVFELFAHVGASVRLSTSQHCGLR
jgi:hypothetical protein